ncbi:MAG: carboxypeptidase regulatory-like domain-containing protein [Deltaproteobacteria bacterium]|nr:carboxypeptidase regulatory-like domain-containing protein [Deltaproteobacteria bacterium]
MFRQWTAQLRATVRKWLTDGFRPCTFDQRLLLVLSTLSLTLASCDPPLSPPSAQETDRDGGIADAGPSHPAARTTASISGTVWAPGNSPVLVIEKDPQSFREEAIPVSRALVYLSDERPAPIPEGVYCEPCVEQPKRSTLSDAKGNFRLVNVLPGEYWLVIQKAHFRFERKIKLLPGADVELPEGHTTLPSVHDPANGKWVPTIALAEGNGDRLEALLCKMGMGKLTSDYIVVPSAMASHIDVYNNVGDGNGGYIEGRLTSIAKGTMEDLVSNASLMMKYQLILIPSTLGPTSPLLNEVVRENIRAYVRAGGKLYVTDVSAPWEDAVFPEFIVFPQGRDISTDELIIPGNGPHDRYASKHARAVDPDLAAWLQLQVAPMVSVGPENSPDFWTISNYIDDNDFSVIDSWTLIEDTPVIATGEEPGNQGVRQAKHWVVGDRLPDGSVGPLVVTFEPTGCGRVYYSTHQTSRFRHRGLIAQERVLLYLMLDQSICDSGIPID